MPLANLTNLCCVVQNRGKDRTQGMMQKKHNMFKSLVTILVIH
jgi:hypothetical protein